MFDEAIDRLQRAGFDVLRVPSRNHNASIYVHGPWRKQGYRFRALFKNGGGDRWAEWTGPDVDGSPVVFLGDGSLRVVARSAHELLQIIAAGLGHAIDGPQAEDDLQQAVLDAIAAQVGPPSDGWQDAEEVHGFVAFLTRIDPSPPWWARHEYPWVTPLLAATARGADAVTGVLEAAAEQAGVDDFRMLGQVASSLRLPSLAARYFASGGLDRYSRTARVQAGERDGVIAELAALAQAAGSVEDVLNLLSELHDLDPDAAKTVRNTIDRDRQPWREAPVEGGSPQARLRAAHEASHAWRTWPLGRTWYRLQEAIEAAGIGDREGARRMLEALDAGASFPDLLARAQEAVDDPIEVDLQELEAAWKAARGGGLATAGAVFGLALVDAGEYERAYLPLEAAAMRLGHAHHLTKAVFAALDVLESKGIPG